MRKKNIEVLEEFRRMETEKLLPMVEAGQVALLLEDGPKIRGVMTAHLVHTTEEKAWKVLLDYDRYRTFLPGIDMSRVISRKEDEIVVKFAAGVKVMGVGGSVRYTYRMKIDKPYVDVYDKSTGELSGYWAILATPDEDRVILVHADVAKDVKSIHVFLRFLVERLPTAEVGLHISPVVMLVNRMKQRMEQVNYSNIAGKK